MKSTFPFLIFLCFTFCSYSQDSVDWYSIKAFIPQWKGATAQLIVDGQVISSQKVESDICSITGIYKEPQLAIVSLQKRGASLFIPLFIERGVIRVRTQTQYSLIPYGTPLNDLYLSTTKGFDSLVMVKALPQAAIKSFKQQQAAQFIRLNTASLISLRLLDDLFYLDHTASDTLYYSLFQLLNPALKASATGRKIGEEAAARYNTALGKKAPQFILPDKFHQQDSLYKSGAITLVNLWASWCAPCRKEHPMLRKLAEAFTGKGLKVVSVSLDTNPALWQKAIREEGLSWQQLSDGKGWESEVVKAYGVKAIPASFLLDEKGVIIGKELSLKDIERKLQDLLRANL